MHLEPRIRISNNNLSQMIADGWDPDGTPWHLYCDDGEYWMIPTWCGFNSGDIDGFTRISTNQEYEGPTN